MLDVRMDLQTPCKRFPPFPGNIDLCDLTIYLRENKALTCPWLLYRYLKDMPPKSIYIELLGGLWIKTQMLKRDQYVFWNLLWNGKFIHLNVRYFIWGYIGFHLIRPSFLNCLRSLAVMLKFDRICKRNKGNNSVKDSVTEVLICKWATFVQTGKKKEPWYWHTQGLQWLYWDPDPSYRVSKWTESSGGFRNLIYRTMCSLKKRKKNKVLCLRS